jgi:AraC-like DNA-binding protein
MSSRSDEATYYNKPVWYGVVFLWLRMLLLERGMYVCRAQETDFHALPIPKVYAPVGGELWVETRGWTAHLESGEKLCLPARDGRQKGVVGWTPWAAKNMLVPGQLTVVKNDFPHRLVGEGTLAFLYPSPDSPEGQRLFTRGDFDRGLAVVTPPHDVAETLTAGLSELLDGRADWPEEEATSLYDKIMEAVSPASDRRQVWPDTVWAAVRGIRRRCRLRRLQCELNTRATLEEIVAYISRCEGTKFTPHWLEKLFRKYLTSTITRLKGFLRLSAAMEYYAALAREAQWSGEYDEPSMTELAAEVHYSDAPEFSRAFHRFHGISPVTFFRGAKFYVIDLD